ncbi:MAG: NAD-binding protein [Candidatus Competibacteraceae bacterium]
MIPREQAALLTLSVALSMAGYAVPAAGLRTRFGAALRDPAPNPKRSRCRNRRSSSPASAKLGQIVGRLLFANGITATVLDHDPDQITLLRRFGFQVFYGDATRLDLLEAAGIAKARLLVVALDDVDANLRLVDVVREHYPRLTVVARARNVSHLFGLMNRNVEHIERETFEAALRSGRRVLRELGFGAHEARLAADTFRRHDLAALDAMRPHYQDEIQLISLAQTARDELSDLFERDREPRARAYRRVGLVDRERVASNQRHIQIYHEWMRAIPDDDIQTGTNWMPFFTELRSLRKNDPVRPARSVAGPMCRGGRPCRFSKLGSECCFTPTRP